MQLSEILVHVRGVLDDRNDALVNGPPDELWDSDILCRYLMDGQRIFCRKAWPIVDATTPACCVIALQENIKVYPWHASVVAILSVTPNDTDIPLEGISYNLMAPQPFTSLPDYYAVPPLPMVEQPGRPGWYSTDEATRTLRIRPAPDANAVTSVVQLNLRVARLPINTLTPSTPDLSPEIPEEYHLDLCDYVVGRALMQPNVDTETRDEGAKFVAAYYQKLRAAKNDRLIAQRQPGRYVFGGWARTARA